MIGSEEEVTKAVEGKAILVDDYFMELTQIILHDLTLSGFQRSCSKCSLWNVQPVGVRAHRSYNYTDD